MRGLGKHCEHGIINTSKMGVGRKTRPAVLSLFFSLLNEGGWRSELLAKPKHLALPILGGPTVWQTIGCDNEFTSSQSQDRNPLLNEVVTKESNHVGFSSLTSLFDRHVANRFLPPVIEASAMEAADFVRFPGKLFYCIFLHEVNIYERIVRAFI